MINETPAVPTAILTDVARKTRIGRRGGTIGSVTLSAIVASIRFLLGPDGVLYELSNIQQLLDNQELKTLVAIVV